MSPGACCPSSFRPVIQDRILIGYNLFNFIPSAHRPSALEMTLDDSIWQRLRQAASVRDGRSPSVATIVAGRRSPNSQEGSSEASMANAYCPVDAVLGTGGSRPSPVSAPNPARLNSTTKRRRDGNGGDRLINATSKRPSIPNNAYDVSIAATELR